MCGIAGIFNLNNAPINKILLRQMIKTLHHRGPDDEGIHIDQFVGLANRRLSIIDLQNGHQPISNENKTIWISANNEIYNHIELRKELEGRGHIFKTHSDTEVIIHLYEEMGEDCVKRLIGMFAISIWDKTKQKLFLARDHLGIKPLYYWHHDHQFAFASELTSLLILPNIDKQLSHESIVDYFKLLYVVEPKTIFQNVHKLPAGHTLTIEKNKASLKRYWDIPFHEESNDNQRRITINLKDALRKSVRITLRSDVPVGTFLSGGIDSSIITLLAAEAHPKIKTISISFNEKIFDESDYSLIVAKRLKTDHYHRTVTDRDAAKFIPKLTQLLDEPFADTSCIPTFFLSQLAAQHVKVVLTGDGGDELFAGYSWHANLKTVLPFRQYVYHRQKLIFNDSGFPLPLSSDFLKSLHKTSLKTSQHLSKLKNIHQDPISQILYADLKTYLPSDMLFKVDRMAMANSLEARVPFLNYPFVEFASQIPSKYKIYSSIQKFILKKAFADKLPKQIINRKKMGFAIPLDIWLWQKGPFRDMIYGVILDRRTQKRKIFDFKQINQMILEHDSLRQCHGYRLWAIFIFEQWLRNYYD